MSSGATRTRSDYGLLRDMARNHVRSFRKKGFRDLVDRLQRDAFYQFNAANQNLIPEAMKFIERLASCIVPSNERSKSQIMGEEKLEVATRLVFVPAAGREETDPLNLHEEVFVNHRGVFLDIGQFAVYVAKILVPYGKPLPIVAGWQDRDFVPDQGTSILIAKSLVEYCKMQWELFASRQVRQGGETAGADREVRLPLASSSVLNPEHPRPHHEQFEPNLQKGKGKHEGPYNKGKGKGKGQQEKGKGKGNYRSPGGAASYDYVGSHGWSQNYRHTWYWNERRGWYWRWD